VSPDELTDKRGEGVDCEKAWPSTTHSIPSVQDDPEKMFPFFRKVEDQAKLYSFAKEPPIL
jgi:hypothetical protein